MTRTVVILIILVLIIVGGFFTLNRYLYSEKSADTMTAESTIPTSTIKSTIPVDPISHATFVMSLGGQVIYNDPVGAEAFAGQPAPDIILVSDIHGDHSSPATVKALATEDTIIIAPQAVADTLTEVNGKVVVLANGEKTTQKSIVIEAVPMYNLPEAAGAFHTKGRGNGYILNAEGKRVYIAGDTSATPEMKALTAIDVAFIPMNLPFTMSVEEAAEGVVAFKPKIVHPYHYRGQSGYSDIEKFKELVNKEDPEIQVELINFYPETK